MFGGGSVYTTDKATASLSRPLVEKYNELRTAAWSQKQGLSTITEFCFASQKQFHVPKLFFSFFFLCGETLVLVWCQVFNNVEILGVELSWVLN
jgi:hypothetical protein